MNRSHKHYVSDNYLIELFEMLRFWNVEIHDLFAVLFNSIFKTITIALLKVEVLFHVELKHALINIDTADKTSPHISKRKKKSFGFSWNVSNEKLLWCIYMLHCTEIQMEHIDLSTLLINHFHCSTMLTNRTLACSKSV